MTTLWMRRLPAALFMLTLVVAVASVVLSAGREPVYDTAVYALNAVALGAAGFMIWSFRPGHRIGVLLTAVGIEAGLVELMEGYGYHRAWAGAGTALWAATWGSFIGIGATVVLPAVFPTGRPLTPRWRPVIWLAVAGVVLAAAGTAFGHGLEVRFPHGVNPYLVGGPLPGIAFAIGQLALILALLGGLVSLAVRYRRSGSEERLQLKWLVYVLCLLAVVGPFAILFYDASVLVQWLIAVTVLLIPVAVGVAVVRYRLYDVDVVISQTLVYAALSTVLGSAWLGAAWVLGAIAGRRHPSWVTAAATVIACAAVLPVRRRLQDVVDRRFRRARYETLARVDAFVEDVRTGRAAPEELEPLLRDVLGLPELRLRYVLPSDRLAPDGHSGTTRSTVRRSGVELAVVEYLGSAPPLLDDVLARAGLAIEIARLHAEVEHQLAEVSRSRERIVAAGYEERRRLERDLHDGAQQRLVAVGLALRHAQHQLGPVAENPVSAGLDEAVGQVAAAIGELREIARGARPSGLDDGLAVALRELAGRTPLRVELDAAPARFPTQIEACAYYLASEALTNAVKHSRAKVVRVVAQPRGTDLMLRVTDDGVGGAEPAGGSGLRGLCDRVASHGGTLEIVSPPGEGTILTARLPCG